MTGAIRGVSFAEVSLASPVPRVVAFPFGVLVAHVREERTFETIGSLAEWRRQSYIDLHGLMQGALDTHGSLLSHEVERPTPSHVLSLYYVAKYGWPEHEHRAALGLLAMPSVLLGRPDDDDQPPHPSDTEDAYLREGFVAAELHDFGVQRVAHGFAAWSGVSYAPIDKRRSLKEADLVELELLVQAAWCYANVISESDAAAATATIADHSRLARALSHAGPTENTQLCLAREAIVETSRIQGLLSAARDSIMHNGGR